MKFPRTYRARLVTYMAVLLVFLVGVLVLVYGKSRELLLDEAQNRITGLTQQLESQLRADTTDLTERAHMLRDNAAFQEYLFIAVSLGTDPAALRELYQRQFGWLHIDRASVVSPSGRALVGPQHQDLVKALETRRRAGTSESTFYLDNPNGLEMVATAAVSYRSQNLGTVAVTRTLGPSWMASVHQETGGELLVVKDGKIIASTVAVNPDEREVAADPTQLTLAHSTYLVRRLKIGNEPAGAGLYFAISQAELTGRLIRQRDLMLLIVAVGALGVLGTGFLMLRNFSAPITRLGELIEEVGEGRFPQFEKMSVKDEIGYLWNRFGAMVKSLRDKQEELNTVHQQLEKQATTDALTGLYNRRYLYDIFPRLWNDARRQRRALSVILVDLDLFKPVNDRFGHLVGDRVLVMLAGVLRDTCRVSDFAFRMGGEEFLVLTQGDIEGAAVLAEKIRGALEVSSLQEGDTTIRITASFGVACAEEADGLRALNQVLTRADKALYAAKQAGRNRVQAWKAPLLIVSNRP